MSKVVPAEGVMLHRVLESAYPSSRSGLDRQAYRRFHAAQAKTAWGARCLQRYALVEGAALLAGATQHNLAAVLDGRPVRVCGIGGVFTDPARTGRGHAHALIDRLLEGAERDGAEMALLFADSGPGRDAPHGFDPVPTTEVEIAVTESSNRGAPMTLIRGGEERDLAAIAAMGQVRAGPFRFHLDRNVDVVQYAITNARLLAGLGAAGARQLHFFIAEEGITAAAYVVVSVVADRWTIEECGDRDHSGARVGAVLQALIAREPIERRPSIRAWLPPGFTPPQVTIVSAKPAAEAMMVRFLGSTAVQRPLSGDEVQYWRGDIF